MTLNQHSIIKKGLLALILVFLWLVILQDLFGWKQVKPLYGYQAKIQDTIFTYPNWELGTYQKMREAHLQQEFSLREDYVRLHNSIQYSMFKKSEVFWVVFSEKGGLMDLQQIHSYLGIDSTSWNDVNRISNYVAAVQDTLSSLNKQLLICIPPNKPNVYPENIPSRFSTKFGENNYHKYVTSFKTRKVDFIDYVDYFKQLRSEGKEYLFPYNGSHWSCYGAALALQHFIDHINQGEKFKLGNINIKSLPLKPETGGEMDIYATMNLLQTKVKQKCIYPDIEVFAKDSVKPRTFFITDSFFAFWMDIGIYELTDSTKYYFYNHRIINRDRSITERKYSPTELLDQYDLFVIMCNTSNLDQLGWGFIEQLYFHFYPFAPNRAYYDPEFRKKVYQKIKEIKKDDARYNVINELAKQNKLRSEEICYQEAVKELHKEIYLAREANGI